MHQIPAYMYRLNCNSGYILSREIECSWKMRNHTRDSNDTKHMNEKSEQGTKTYFLFLVHQNTEKKDHKRQLSS